MLLIRKNILTLFTSSIYVEIVENPQTTGDGERALVYRLATVKLPNPVVAGRPKKKKHVFESTTHLRIRRNRILLSVGTNINYTAIDIDPESTKCKCSTRLLSVKIYILRKQHVTTSTST